MVRLWKTTALLGLFVVVGLVTVSASAGILNTGKTYTDENMPLGWEGFTEFVGDEDPNLSGSVDWAVFAPGKFAEAFTNATFPVDYTLPSDLYTYVYQVHCTGVYISLFAVGLEAAATDIAWFTADGVTGDQPIDDYNIVAPPGGAATWNFTGIDDGASSRGLVFCSPKTPMEWFSVVVDEGSPANGIIVASPSPMGIPEPATIWLLAGGLGLALAARRFRRG